MNSQVNVHVLACISLWLVFIFVVVVFVPGVIYSYTVL